MTDTLPKGWSKAPLVELLREPLRNGHSSSASKNGEGIRTLTLTSVTVGDFSESNTKLTVADPTKVEDLWLEPGDILIERSNTPELVGTARLYMGEQNYAIFPDLLIRVRLSKGVSPKLAEAFLHATPSRNYFRRAAQGIAGSMPKISQGTIEDLLLLVPPIPEQHRIVNTLESYFTRLDDAVETLERVERNLKRYRASVLKSAVEGRLVPTEAALAKHEGRDYEPASVLLERILTERRRRWAESGKKGNYEEPAHPDMANLPELPDGWCWATVDMMAEVKGGLTKGGKRKSGTQLREVPYLRVANVQRGFLDLAEVKTIGATDAEIQELRLEPGDVLFNEGGDRDKLGRGWIWASELPECIHQNHVFRARLLSDDISSRYLSWYGNGSGQAYFFDQGKQTTNLASINLTKLKGLPVPIPPKHEQARIVVEVDRLLSVTDDCVNDVARNTVRCQRLRQSILKWAFEGKLADQDPNDEPASVLLERIKAERDIPKSATKKVRA